MNAWVFLHWSIISLCFSRYFFYVDRLALCLVLWFMLGCYLLHFSMGCMFDLTHPHLNPLIQTCNMAWMGSFYPFPLCSVCYFPMFSMPCHGEQFSILSEILYRRAPTIVASGAASVGAGAGRRWLVLAGAGWCWLVLVSAGWCWLALTGAGQRWLVQALARHPVTMPMPPQATHSTPVASLLLLPWACPLMMGVGLSWSPGPFVRVRSLMPAIFLAQVHLKLVSWACPYW